MCLTGVLILFRFSRLNGGKYASVFIYMDRFHSVCGYPFDVLHYGKLLVFYFVQMFSYVILCLISVVGGQGFWPVVGRGVPLSGFSGFLRVASLSGVTLVN